MKLLSEHYGEAGTVLDLGCGPRDQAAPLEWIGFKYVGVDYSSPQADFLADAHSLPFKDESFDCVLSYAVLEHLHHPFVAIREINRVLKTGGIYIGTVSQGEPFHASYFHHTPWGFLSLISHASDMQPERLWASMDTLQSLSRMGRYPRVIKSILRIVDFIHSKVPILAPRKMHWSAKEKELDALFRAGSICFLCRKSSTDLI
jgi:SAM-dependent methyltransferase